MFDIAAHLGAMSRVVESRERDGKPARAVIASRVYDTNAADLWDALTDPERLKRWFAPVTGDLKLGGRYTIQGNASGTITECEPERKIAVTWEFGGGISWVMVTLTPDGDGTRLQLEHLALEDPHYAKFGPGAVGVGWDLGFLGLSRHLAEPDAEVPQEAIEGWMASPEAKDFVRATSDDWGRAAIASGESSAEALQAAEETRKFYTGEATPGM